MSKLENIEERLNNVNNIANEVARRANNEIAIARHKITCLTVIIGLLLILGASIAMFSIHSLKELFYDMTVEEVGQHVDAGDGGNATGIIGNNNEVNH